MMIRRPARAITAGAGLLLAVIVVSTAVQTDQRRSEHAARDAASSSSQSPDGPAGPSTPSPPTSPELDGFFTEPDSAGADDPVDDASSPPDDRGEPFTEPDTNGASGGAASSGAEQANDTSGEPADEADAVTGPASDGRILRFKLSYLKGSPENPNAKNYAQHVEGDRPLLLFLPATGATPGDYQEFLSTAVASGYNVLGLQYWNIGKSVTRTCGADANCYTDVQRNRFDGTRPGKFSRVDAANSILHRFRASIAYLQEHDPKGDWDRFLDDRDPVWSRIVLAGHSQGGGESAFIAHYHRVRGVLMFSSPVETFGDTVASWIGKPGATPLGRMYAFDVQSDMYYDRIVPTWAHLGLGTPDPTQIRKVPTGSHVLISDLDVGTPREAHGRSVSDGGPRGSDGRMRFLATWNWMLAQVRDPDPSAR
ncbi:hypothetical protein [Schumannella sp. 10F1B-5-1]|uniref:BPSS1187 family protein n=1 Tax=Schumannella sp. 10F1B-5-1 TaxID=2590780 RepID=UPI00116A71D4|nr:hypothetical protein [Schumannella sp. 10F1B-5-1]TPW76738.1 hypothetical protein FJ658_02000 [Schumannella sp. 10F1B-5-1]